MKCLIIISAIFCLSQAFVPVYRYSYPITNFNRHTSADTKVVSKLSRLDSVFQQIFKNVIICSIALILPAQAISEELPSLEKCFSAIELELDPMNGKSIPRLADDIKSSNWDDIKLFTREYDAGFRGYVLKSAWKQLEGKSKDKGIELANCFTYDLIALNKAARNKNVEEAESYLTKVKQDLVDFLTLKQSQTNN